MEGRSHAVAHFYSFWRSPTALARLIGLGAAAGRTWAQCQAALGAGLGEALGPAERQALTLALYRQAGGEGRALFDWEQAWYRAHLPPSPAHLLVAGAGAGAEVAALVARGYTVEATEPVARLATACRTRGARAVWDLDHEAWAQAVLDGGTAPWAERRYAAVLLGWGSLTHVLTAEGRQRTWAAAAAVTSGPVLASFWTVQQAGPPPGGRLVATGTALGRAVGARRGVQGAGSAERFAAWCGFGALVDPAEVEATAAALGRRVVWGEGPYPHVALI